MSKTKERSDNQEIKFLSVIVPFRNEIENIEQMIAKTKPKREDGIELIINDTIEKDEQENEKKEENNEGEKKIINL